MRFASLGSGSRGNGTLVQNGATTVLVDCGFSLAESERRLARLGIEPHALTAILVTHEHGDHAGGVSTLARKHHLPVWASAGTFSGWPGRKPKRRHILPVHEAFSLDALHVEPYPVPHDAREPCQFTFSDGMRRLGVLTDVGSLTPHLVRMLSGCDALLLECNYDPDMLANGPYPPSLQARISGRLGHLSNAQSAELLSRIDTRRLRHLVAAHLSEKNNTPGHARQALATALNCSTDWITVADQESGMDWCEVS